MKNMSEAFFQGDRLLNYCVKCGIDYGTSKIDDKTPTCDNCGGVLKTKFAGLALSGGGYRAALFHLGSLWRLNELGWLKRLAEVTSVSGGSITAAYLGLRWKYLKFDDSGVADNFPDDIVTPVRALCSKTIDVPGVLAGLFDPFHRSIEYIAYHYRTELFGKKTLQDLPLDNEGPRFTIYATNLMTGASVRFSRPYLAEYHLGHIDLPRIPLATAVAASCAIPPIMRPMVIKFKAGAWKDWEDMENNLRKDIEKLRSVLLNTDGGVYDNLGLERVWHRYETVLVSDAGAPFATEKGTFWLNFVHIMSGKRAIDIAMEQDRALRKRWLMNDLISSVTKGTYWGIATEIGHYELEKYGHAPPLVRDSDTTRKICQIRTRLNRFTAEEQERLINWGYALTDAAMRRHVLEEEPPPGRLPYPERSM
jgi:NTE family protein